MELSPDNPIYIAAHKRGFGQGLREGRLLGRRGAVVTLLTALDPDHVDEHRDRVEGLDLAAVDALLEETFKALEAR